jgi:hypothetical protein
VLVKIKRANMDKNKISRTNLIFAHFDKHEVKKRKTINISLLSYGILQSKIHFILKWMRHRSY